MKEITQEFKDNGGLSKDWPEVEKYYDRLNFLFPDYVSLILSQFVFHTND